MTTLMRDQEVLIKIELNTTPYVFISITINGNLYVL